MKAKYLSHTHVFDVDGVCARKVKTLLEQAGKAFIRGKDVHITCCSISDGVVVGHTVIGNKYGRLMTEDELVNTCLFLCSTQCLDD